MFDNMYGYKNFGIFWWLPRVFDNMYGYNYMFCRRTSRKETDHSEPVCLHCLLNKCYIFRIITARIRTQILLCSIAEIQYDISGMCVYIDFIFDGMRNVEFNL